MTRPNVSAADAISARSLQVTALLESHFPTHRSRSNSLDIPSFAKAIGLSYETIYRAVRGVVEIKLPIACKLVRFSHTNQDANPLYLTDLLPFIVHDWATLGEEPDVDLADDVDDLLA